MKPTKKQQSWMSRVEKLLSNPPPNVGLYTIGDKSLEVYDLRKEEQINSIMDRGYDFCSAVHDLDAGLGSIDSTMNIHSTSG